MSSLRELAIAKLHAKAGQEPGHLAGQQVSRTSEIVSGPWDSENGGIVGEMDGCPAVPPPKDRDSGTVAPKPGHSAGQQAGQSGILDERIAAAKLREWHARLSQLDVYEPPEGFDKMRWGTLLHDCWWLYETHASRLVRDGWTAADLFLVLPSQRGWGGLADRLQGARNVLFDDRGLAHWRRRGEKFSVGRGIGESLHDGGYRVVWSLRNSRRFYIAHPAPVQ
jgi:hypothetical protein